LIVGMLEMGAIVSLHAFSSIKQEARGLCGYIWEASFKVESHLGRKRYRILSWFGVKPG